MRKALFLTGLVFLSSLTLFSQIDYSLVDTTIVPPGQFSKLVNKFHGNGNQKIVHLGYDAERSLIIYGIEWISKFEAGKDLFLIELTDSGLVRRLFTTYNPNFSLQFENNFIYVISPKRIEIYNMNEISKPVTVPYWLDYKLTSRLTCSNGQDFECIGLEFIDSNNIHLKKVNKLTSKAVKEIYYIKNGKLTKI